MPQICTVCRHQKRSEIDEALLQGEPYRLIAARTGTSTGALARHKHGHIPLALATAKQTNDLEYAGTIFERLKSINRETVAILHEARAAETPAIALMAVGRIEKQLELEARLLGELDNRTRIDLGITVDQNAEVKLDRLIKAMTENERDQFACLIDSVSARAGI